MKSARSHLFKFAISSLLISNLLSFEDASASALACTNLFSPQFGNSSEQIDKTISELSALRVNLDQAISNGTNSTTITALNSDYLIKEKALIEYINQHRIMTREQLIEKMRQEIQKIQNERKQNDDNKRDNKNDEARRRREQKEMIKNSLIDGTHAVMHRIEPGSFKMDEVGKQIDVTITKPFDMMATPTTQIVWRTIADLAAQKLAGKYQINADPSSFKGDTRPVEQVSYDDIQTWLSALNELSAAGEPALAELIPRHKTGDVYRLPTEAEWDFVIRGRGQYNDTYHFGNQEAQLGDYAWYTKNSGHQTHPVAQKKPLVIDGKDFYDMHGNVWEWTQDWFRANLPGGTDPQGPAQGSNRVVSGGSWVNIASTMGLGDRYAWEPDTRTSSLGFRFVRVAR